MTLEAAVADRPFAESTPAADATDTASQYRLAQERVERLLHDQQAAERAVEDANAELQRVSDELRTALGERNDLESRMMGRTGGGNASRTPRPRTPRAVAPVARGRRARTEPPPE